MLSGKLFSEKILSAIIKVSSEDFLNKNSLCGSLELDISKELKFVRLTGL